MKKLSSIEILRKLIHLSSLIYPILYLILDDKVVMLFITGTLLTVILIVEILRKRFIFINGLFCKYCGFSLRNKERSGLTGGTFFMIGVFFTILFYSQSIAVLSMFILVISDTFASIVGLSFGRRKIVDNKTIEGSIAFLLSALIISCIGGIYFNLSLPNLMVASVFTTILELLNKRIKIDDNILIPLGHGLIVSLLL
jgi:dolichol kinase